MSAVAGPDAAEQRRADLVPVGQFDEEADVTGERPASEGGAGREVCLRADASLALETAFDLLGVGTDRLADAGQLVDERDRRRQEGVESVLGHLRRLDR